MDQVVAELQEKGVRNWRDDRKSKEVERNNTKHEKKNKSPGDVKRKVKNS